MTEFPWPVHPAADLFPLLGDDELRELADDIKANGLLEPVWLYRGDHVMLLDGRNRYRACEMAGVELRMRYYDGADPIAFSLSLNLKRRHLTAGQKAFTALEVEKLYAAQAKRGRPPQEMRADLPAINESRHPSRDKAAAATGASSRAVGQAKRVAEQAPDLADKVKAGQIAIDRAERIIRDREAEQRRIDQARREAAAQPVETLVDIRQGDFREVLADLAEVDAIITDPPYPPEYLPLLDDLASWADKVLAPDGVLAVLFGNMHLPEVYRRLGGHRPYRWTCCYLTPGANWVSHARRVQTGWKPLLVYGGGPRLADVINSAGGVADARNNHKWGQDYAAFHTIIERLTVRGQTVCDPFMGSGTTLLAAKALGRHAIGSDVDLESVATARQRLA